jgi:putative Mg2+ transporter-C (MgtC) family protein
MQDVFAWPDSAQLLRITARLLAAAILGGLIGLEREHTGKAAGLRTHMLVALGSAVFTLAPREAGMAIADLSRIFQGVITGIGFVGAGAILKLSSDRRIVGLTTATSIWLTAAVGCAVAVGALWLPVLAVGMALVILAVLRRLENRLGEHQEPPRP